MNAATGSRPRRHLAVALMGLALGCGAAQAAQHCVSTGTQLANALNSAASNNQDDEIRIVATTLSGTSNPVGNPRWGFTPGANDLDKNLTITGGWSSGNNCNSQISTDPSDTVLDSNFSGRALQFQVLTGPFEGDVVLRNFTISRGSSSVQNSGTSLEWRVTGSAVSSLLAENLLVIAAASSTAFTQPVLVEHSGSGNAKLRNIMVFGNSTQGTGGIFIRASGTAFAILSNASIFDNHCACAAAGLGAGGIVTLANNAVADNTSSAASSFQFRSDAPTGLTLRNNHFGTKSMAGSPNSETGTTTGDAQWTQVGSLIIPNTISPLRDSGINNPTGQLSSTDFKGDARIVNTTVDRGAVEAEAIPHIGPTISAVAPTPGIGLFMPDGLINTTHTRSITFAATGGTGAGTTSLVCTDNNNAATLSASASQTIAVGDTVAPIVVTMTYTQAGYNLGVFCTANTNGNTYSFEYAFFMPNASPLGPLVQPVSPQVGSTTVLNGQTVGQLASGTLTFTAQGGAVGGQASLTCAPLSGVIAVTGNDSQTITAGGTVLPVEVSMQVTGQAQSASVRCVASRVGSAPVNMDYLFTLNSLDTILGNGFED
ncbi:MAG: hypothetical protein IPO95_05380 [Rhodanobacteraceae bacterium]|nr:hypothetical protein [Rhodanobacteraceae bacterium]MBL0042272.1 hypothetical protein [Xanthomonadales bacterium]